MNFVSLLTLFANKIGFVVTDGRPWYKQVISGLVMGLWIAFILSASLFFLIFIPEIFLGVGLLLLIVYLLIALYWWAKEY